MQISKNRIFENVGLAGVIASLIFVAFELRQANKIALVNSVSDVYEKYTGINAILISDPNLAELITTHREALSELSTADQERRQSWNFILLNTWLSANVAYDNGILAESTFHGVLDDISYNLRVTDPAGRQSWRRIMENYPGLHELEVIRVIKSELDKYDK